jgi:hypothetical protein
MDKESDIKTPDKYDYSNLTAEEFRTLEAILSKAEKVTDNSIRIHRSVKHI